MRIVGGRFGGRSLRAPTGADIRPSSDRLRENLFNILQNRVEWSGIRAMDLFAGTGALGIEALSRGAEFVLFVDNSTQAQALIRSNLDRLGLGKCARLYRRDAARPGAIGTLAPFGLAFADPPYRAGLGERCAHGLAHGGWLRDGALFVLEEAADALPTQLAHFECVDHRRYGDSAIGIFRFDSHRARRENDETVT